MTRPALIAALVLLPAAVEPATEPPWLRPMERQAETHYQLPGGLLGRVRAYEGDRDVIALRPGGLVCGRYQIWADRSYRTCGFARGPAGVWMAAQLLAESRDRCEKLKAKFSQRKGAMKMICPWARWNWRDRTALCKALDGGEI